MYGFRESVFKIVKQIPEGKVATYGQIAALIGNVRAARQVGFALRALTIDEREIPWWRVVNREGVLSINRGEMGIEKVIQKDLLLDEGIHFESEYQINIKEYLWNPNDILSKK